jgi:hypothetical protein
MTRGSLIPSYYHSVSLHKHNLNTPVKELVPDLIATIQKSSTSHMQFPVATGSLYLRGSISM